MTETPSRPLTAFLALALLGMLMLLERTTNGSAALSKHNTRHKEPLLPWNWISGTTTTDTPLIFHDKHCPLCTDHNNKTTQIPATNATLPQTQRALQSFEPGEVTFYVTGDAPYDAYQASLLESYMENLPSSAAFVVHVGDMRYAGNGDKCRWGEYTNVAGIMLQSRAPVFMLVGDNDIHDCPDQASGEEYWSRNLDRLWEKSDRRFPARVETLSGVPGTWTFVLNNILFIGVHVTDAPSSFVRSQAVWCRNLINQYRKYMSPLIGRVVMFGHSGPWEGYNDHYHQYLFEYLSQNFGDTALPLVYIQGDTHYWDVERKFYGNPAWMRIFLQGEADEAPTRITVTSNGEWQNPLEAFRFQRQ